MGMVACMNFSSQVGCRSGAGLRWTHAANRVLPTVSAVGRTAPPKSHSRLVPAHPSLHSHAASYPFVVQSVGKVMATQMDTVVEVTKWVFSIMSAVAQQ